MNDRDEDRDPTGADGTDRVDTDPDGASPDAPAADGAPTGGDTTGGVDVDLKHEVAAYVVGFVPVSPKADLFARVGYSASKFDTSLGDVKDDGVAYGVGGQYHFTDKDGVRLDWTRHDYDVGNADVWALAYTRKF